jgi:hypothetical protein
MHINISELAGTEIMAGSLGGRKLLSQLIETVAEPLEAEPCFLDFKDVQVATASFLRDSVLEFRRLVRTKRSSVYPVIGNASEEILEDLALVLRFRGDAMLACDLNKALRPSRVRVIGQLEAVQRETFELVKSLGEVDTKTLVREQQRGPAVGLTAWNNRLSALVSKGLLMERTLGRSKSYRPVIRG